jgi:hypothetical protein
VRWADYDDKAGTLTITGKVIRVTGQGLLRVDETKSAAGRRTLPPPVPLKTASTLRAATTGSPKLSQMDSAAALSDSVIAALVASVTCGGLSSRRAAITRGTLIVDHAGPPGQSPRTTGVAESRTASIAIPVTPCRSFANGANSAVSVDELLATPLCGLLPHPRVWITLPESMAAYVIEGSTSPDWRKILGVAG